MIPMAKVAVSCPLRNGNKETIFVYYTKSKDGLFPLPPNTCDNSDGSEVCLQCVKDVLLSAINADPPLYLQ